MDTSLFADSDHSQRKANDRIQILGIYGSNITIAKKSRLMFSYSRENFEEILWHVSCPLFGLFQSHERRVNIVQAPLILIAAVVVTGLVFVVIPVALDAYGRFRHGKVLICPDTGLAAEVRPKALRGALMTALARKPIARVKWCSLWPERKGCDEKCMKENWPSS